VNLKGMRALTGASLVIALLQSLCTAVLSISGIRVAIGLSALAAASGIYAPARGFHQDAIRIPMLTLAAVGAIVDLAVACASLSTVAPPGNQSEGASFGTPSDRVVYCNSNSRGVGDMDPSHGSPQRSTTGH